MFARQGVLTYPVKAASSDAMFEAALDAGAENVESGDEGHEILTTVEEFASVRDALEKKFGPATEARLAFRPQTTVPLGEEQARALFEFLETLDDNDDVQTVTANFEVADDIMARIGAEA
jgi:transcriptional/translational regulatory protein YebC/TACO1